MTFVTPRASSLTTSSTRKGPDTQIVTSSPPDAKTITFTGPSSAQGSLSTSAPTTKGPQSLCPRERCQNGGSCKQTQCYCLEKFAGVYCEVYVGKPKVFHSWI